MATKNQETVINKTKPILASKTITAKRRPALGELTNVHNENDTKQLVKKGTSQKVVEKKILKPLQPIKQVKTKETEQNDKVVCKEKSIGNDDKRVEINAYSVQYFGLIKENDSDPSLVPIYINEIMVYLRDLEKKYTINNKFMVAHKTTPRMRSVLVNWLVDVHLNFKLVSETLYLCVSIIDRYLNKNKTVGRDNLQLVGAAALFLACKYEETYVPCIDDFTYMCDDIFTKKHILQMEQSILKTVNYSLGSPNALHFLRRYSKLTEVNSTHHNLSKFILESTLLQHEFSSVLPSLLAASASSLSTRLLCTPEQQTKTLKVLHYVSGYNRHDISPFLKKLAGLLLTQASSKYRAVRKKYSTISSKIEDDLLKKIAEVK